MKPRAIKNSPFLDKPLRSEAEAAEDCHQARLRMNMLWGHKPVPHDHEATAQDVERREVSTLTRQLDNAVWKRSYEERPLSMEERSNLVALRATITSLLENCPAARRR